MIDGYPGSTPREHNIICSTQYYPSKQINKIKQTNNKQQQMLGMSAFIVMPSDAPAMKIANTRSFGAEVRLYDRATESRESIAASVTEQRGSVLVPPFEDTEVMAGQGTAALEAMQQLSEMHEGVNDPASRRFDLFVVPVGGGGLISGCSVALATLSPTTVVVGVEPEDFVSAVHSSSVPPHWLIFCLQKTYFLRPVIPPSASWECRG
jgi:cysteine synthase